MSSYIDFCIPSIEMQTNLGLQTTNTMPETSVNETYASYLMLQLQIPIVSARNCYKPLIYLL